MGLQIELFRIIIGCRLEGGIIDVAKTFRQRCAGARHLHGGLALSRRFTRRKVKRYRAAELALYKGNDREKILLEGAKKEGQLTFYTSNTWVAGPVSQEFEKKYPFIKANVWRSDSKALLKRLTEEHAAGKYLADVVETSPEYVTLLVRSALLQDHFSPELGAYDDDAKVKGKSGVLAWTNREIYISLGYNTKLVSAAEAPKTLKDYLDPKWKGKMSIAGTTTGTQWIGAVLDAMGREFLEKLSAQEINVQNMSGAALSGSGRFG